MGVVEEEEIPHPKLAAELPVMEICNEQITPRPAILEYDLSDSKCDASVSAIETLQL